MTLNEWQTTVETHFSSLKTSRLGSGRIRHVFALEHGLSVHDVKSLSSEIQDFSRHSRPAERHWLTWVIYATELGYIYSGDEYWQTFADRTPGWSDLENDRDYIRDAFIAFHKRYSGIQPSGRWASHFSKICWPITHAILPRDFQKQLAEILYYLRHSYNEQLLGSPELLGRAVEDMSRSASRRFQKFAEQHLLVGQIALGLLQSEHQQVEDPIILPTTLQRIASDLATEQRSREWLATARKQALNVSVKGAERGLGLDTSADIASASPREQIVRLGIEPTLRLRLIESNTWEVRIHIPCLAPLLARFPEFKSILAEQRCVVKGAKDKRPVARQTLLRGDVETTLAVWPRHSDVLLAFEKSCPALDQLLRTDCLLRPGPRWVLKVDDDGCAREVKSKTLHTGSKYVVLSSDPKEIRALHPQPVNVACEGIHGYLVDVPAAIPFALTKELEDTGFSIGSSLSVWPVAVSPADWDEEGHVEYLSTDAPCIAIGCDFQTDGATVELQGSCPGKLQIPGKLGRDPILIELGKLQLGSHLLCISTSHLNQTIHAAMRVQVREPSSIPKRPVVLSIVSTPANPTLEELWTSKTDVEVYGPEGSMLHGEIVFFNDLARAKRIAATQIGPVPLPMSSSAFRSLIGRAFEKRDMQNAYDEAACCSVRFICPGIGEHSLICEREPSPCRWAVRYENQSYWLRLVHVIEERGPKYFRCSFSRPDLLEPLAASDFQSRFRVPTEGGLYFAREDAYQCAIVVPSSVRSLQQLLTVSTIPRQRTEADVIQVLSVYQVWAAARIVGDPVSAWRKRDALLALSHWLEQTFCESPACRVSRDCDYQSRLRTMKEYLRNRHAGLAFALNTIERQIALADLDRCAELLCIYTKSYFQVPAISIRPTWNMSSLQWLTEFGLRMFSEPEQVEAWAGDDFKYGLRYLLRIPELARFCRYASLVRTVTGDLVNHAHA